MDNQDSIRNVSGFLMVLVCGLALPAVALWVLAWTFLRRLPPKEKSTFAFFHPSAMGGGGGERVLWMTVQILSKLAPRYQLCIYCEAGQSCDDLKRQAHERFGVRVDADLRIVPLTTAYLLDSVHWPHFTMLGQAYASIRVAWEALNLLTPEIWMDTTGWAFPYPLVSWAGSQIACYVHYPTISTDMLTRVRSRTSNYNNSSRIASSFVRSIAKLAYYNVVARVYGATGWWPQVVMVNSRWTEGHVQNIWWRWWKSRPTIVYPPCDTAFMQTLPLLRPLKTCYFASVAQFRPEKNHRLQIEALAMAKQRMHEEGVGSESARGAHIKFVGGCRHDEDRARMAQLEKYAEDLGVASSVEFRPDVHIDELRNILGSAVAGLHSMVDEHFGISVVEYMAAGVVTIAHDSGGPKEDIVIPAMHDQVSERGEPVVGFRATTVEQYANCMIQVLTMEEDHRMAIAAAARQKSQQFSNERFQVDVARALKPLLRSSSS